MRAVYQAADKRAGTCLLSPLDLYETLSLDLDFDDEELDLVYCINMHQKGLAFARVERAFRSNIRFKILLAVVGGLCSGAAALGIRLLIQKLSGL